MTLINNVIILDCLCKVFKKGQKTQGLSTAEEIYTVWRTTTWFCSLWGAEETPFVKALRNSSAREVTGIFENLSRNHLKVKFDTYMCYHGTECASVDKDDKIIK